MCCFFFASNIIGKGLSEIIMQSPKIIALFPNCVKSMFCGSVTLHHGYVLAWVKLLKPKTYCITHLILSKNGVYDNACHVQQASHSWANPHLRPVEMGTTTCSMTFEDTRSLFSIKIISTQKTLFSDDFWMFRCFSHPKPNDFYKNRNQKTITSLHNCAKICSVWIISPYFFSRYITDIFK